MVPLGVEDGGGAGVLQKEMGGGWRSVRRKKHPLSGPLRDKDVHHLRSGKSFVCVELTYG